MLLKTVSFHRCADRDPLLGAPTPLSPLRRSQAAAPAGAGWPSGAGLGWAGQAGRRAAAGGVGARGRRSRAAPTPAQASSPRAAWPPAPSPRPPPGLPSAGRRRVCFRKPPPGSLREAVPALVPVAVPREFRLPWGMESRKAEGGTDS